MDLRLGGFGGPSRQLRGEAGRDCGDVGTVGMLIDACDRASVVNSRIDLSGSVATGAEREFRWDSARASVRRRRRRRGLS